jgi:hypothetical protein
MNCNIFIPLLIALAEFVRPRQRAEEAARRAAEEGGTAAEGVRREGRGSWCDAAPRLLLAYRAITRDTLQVPFVNFMF